MFFSSREIFSELHSLTYNYIYTRARAHAYTHTTSTWKEGGWDGIRIRNFPEDAIMRGRVDDIYIFKSLTKWNPVISPKHFFNVQKNFNPNNGLKSYLIILPRPWWPTDVCTLLPGGCVRQVCSCMSKTTKICLDFVWKIWKILIVPCSLLFMFLSLPTVLHNTSMFWQLWTRGAILLVFHRYVCFQLM